MENKINATYLSDQIQNCLMEIITQKYHKTGSYMGALIDVTEYLISDSNKYNSILNEYNVISKQQLKQMIFSNFLEITYYRKKLGIPLNDVRLNILEAVEKAEPKDNSLAELLYVEGADILTMINDVVLYFYHPSKIYSYNAVKTLKEDNFVEKLYDIYPLAKLEHSLTLLADEYTGKEYLLFTLIEILVNETEKQMFINQDIPMPDQIYLQKIANMLRKHNGTNSNLPNLHKNILAEFNSRIGITKGIDYNKVLILEILFMTAATKHRCCIPEEKDEKYIMNELNKMDMTIESLSTFYDNNEQKIISTLINNWNLFENETILRDVEIFSNIKKTDCKKLQRK